MVELEIGGTPFIGVSDKHRRILEQLERVAPTDAEVLIAGPSGVGKELYARYLHRLSPRRAAGFVPLNCGAIPTELFENELFGHVGGAFTGARLQSEGVVSAAERGTLFLDEIDSLSMAGQVKLLRFIQDKEYRRLGEARVRRADVRFVAATNADLAAAVQQGRFRADLFFRLRVVPVRVPPLCERREDILPIFRALATRYAALYNTSPVTPTAAAEQRLERYGWPGNIRELENCVRYLTCLQLPHPVDEADLPLLGEATPAPPAAPAIPAAPAAPTANIFRDATAATPAPRRRFQDAKREVVNRFEREYLREALQRTSGNIGRAAEESGKARRAFFELLRKHKLDASEFRGSRPRR